MNKKKKTSTLFYRCLFVLLMLAGLAFASYMILESQIQNTRFDAALVHISGRQRMLMERTALLARYLVNTKDMNERANVRKQLLEAIQQLESYQDAIIHGDKRRHLPGNPPSEIRDIYFKPPALLDTRLRKYLIEIKVLARTRDLELSPNDSRLDYIRTVASGKVLAALDAVVNQYQKQMEAKIALLHHLQGWIFSITLVVLLLTGLFVFLPMVRQVRQKMEVLEKLNQTLAERIVERKRVEEMSQHLAAIVDSSADAITSKTLEGIIQSWNQGAERLYGYSPQEALGRPISLLSPPDRPDEAPQMLERLKNGERIKNYETVRVKKDGAQVDVSLSISPIKNAEGQIIAISTIARDITERLRSQEALKKVVTDLAASNQEQDKLSDELRSANIQLERLALLDPLTELLNRRGLQQALSFEIPRIRRDQSDFHVLLADIDDFKGINDTFGHAVGDVALKEITHKLRASLRLTDYVARIGGDEFMILLPETRYAEGMRIAEKIRIAISASPILLASGRTVHVTASLGCVAVSPDTATIDELLTKTHLALQKSKSAGKNRVTYGHHGHNQREHQETGQQILENLQMALRQTDKLRVLKQPIMLLADSSEIGYEFLSRSSIEGFEMPDDFFRVCLESNMLTLVDHQCLKSCIAAGTVLSPQIRRHVNLFPSTIIDIPIQHLVETIPANSLKGAYCIEISEQQIIGDPSYLVKPVQELKELNVLVAIDDIGFGRSCLESLILLEPDIVKIDKKCVKGIARDMSHVRSLKRLLKILDTLGSDVIAEGIESQEDLDVLKDLGVQYGQGFFWGKPA